MPRFYLLTCSSQPGNPSFYVKWPRRHFKNPVKLAFSHSKGGEPGIGPTPLLQPLAPRVGVASRTAFVAGRVML